MPTRLQGLVPRAALVAAGLVLVQPVRGDTPVEPVPVRIETRGDFLRLSFAWRRLVDYEVARRGSVLTIAFARSAPLEGTAAIAGSELILAALPSRTEDRTTVVLTLAPETRVRYFRKELDLVVDVMPPLPEPAREPAARVLAAGSVPAFR